MEFKKIFCKHDYKLIEGNVPVHFPDYEPVKYGQILRCEKCNKEIRFLEKFKYDYIGEINQKIEEYNNAKVIDTNNISDGYHTFEALYYQRCILFATICNTHKDISWKSKKHSNGKKCFDSDEWFIVGIDTPEGSYTYHYEMKYWDLFNVQELEKGKDWDGHTEKDVIRLLSLI